MDYEKEIYSALKRYFGYSQFRPNQEDIINSILDGKDVLVIMPTGGGKSMCYQIPAIVKDGLTIVVSPLIALMKDQVDTLQSNGVEAYALNSQLEDSDRHIVYTKLEKKEIKMLYLSPEYLVNNFDFIHSLNPVLFAIDEAHCISSWGHDFRPEYQQLNILKEEFPNVPIIALTATADKEIQQDIINNLKLADVRQFNSSFDRPNIHLEVKPGVKRIEKIYDFIRLNNGAGIIYCLSRKGTEEVAKKLMERGISAKAYHAGLESSERDYVQNLFFNDKIKVICATIAFGMGIDKPNIRFVIHYNLPKNIEGYYQEIGRAGRDGLPSKALLFFSYGDVITLKKFASSASNQDVLDEKLNRMYEYANASFCRRKMLLGYFNEYSKVDNCGNCDICVNPPTYIDGTVISQKILSAIYKTNQNIGINLLINILRGSKSYEILNKGYNQISPYGIGADVSFEDWRNYVNQLINQGYIEMGYSSNMTLKLNNNSREILFSNKKVQLTDPNQIILTEEEPDLHKAEQDMSDDLFAELKKLRYAIAQKEGMPPFIVFHDKSLIEMATVKPTTKKEFNKVHGVSTKKLQKYGDQFIALIKKF